MKVNTERLRNNSTNNYHKGSNNWLVELHAKQKSDRHNIYAKIATAITLGGPITGSIAVLAMAQRSYSRALGWGGYKTGYETDLVKAGYTVPASMIATTAAWPFSAPVAVQQFLTASPSNKRVA